MIDHVLKDLGIQLSEPELRSELAYALGVESAHERVRLILANEYAKRNPVTALKLALDSSLAADTAISILRDLPPQEADHQSRLAPGDPQGGGEHG